MHNSFVFTLMVTFRQAPLATLTPSQANPNPNDFKARPNITDSQSTLHLKALFTTDETISIFFLNFVLFKQHITDSLSTSLTISDDRVLDLKYQTNCFFEQVCSNITVV